jgi:hypothetical protein
MLQMYSSLTCYHKESGRRIVVHTEVTTAKQHRRGGEYMKSLLQF